jgi:hypothetical protein
LVGFGSALLLMPPAAGGWLAAQERGPHRPRAGISKGGGVEQAQPEQPQLREGTKIDKQRGQFRVTGDRITFYPSGAEHSFRALENLALERVARVLGETQSQRVWSVSGVVTEYQGVNFLLVTRAVLQSRHRWEVEDN